MMKIKFLCIAIFALLAVAQANKMTRLSITQPQQLIEKIEAYNKRTMKNYTSEDSNLIECELSNFGSVQYGSRTIGLMQIAKPYDACNNTRIETESRDEYSQRIPFLLAERGGSCGFVDKVYNAQEIGAQIVIIADNIKEKGNVVMIDNGHGKNVHITSVFISRFYGEIIKQFAEQQPHSQIILSLELFQKKQESSQARFWIDLASPLSKDVIRGFSRIRKSIQANNFTTEPIFAMTKMDNPINKEDCEFIGKSYYCVPDPDITTNSKNVATGQDVINEIYRQTCIHQQGEEFWYSYFEKFGNQCSHVPQYYLTCGILVINEIEGLDKQRVTDCINSETDKLRILGNQVEINSQFKIFEWPAVTVNELLIRGNLDGHGIAQAICNSLNSIDNECLLVIDPNAQIRTNTQGEIKDQIAEESSIFWTLLFIIFGFILLFLIMAYAYKKIVKKEISEDMNQQVNQMVSQYIAFYESKGKGNTDQSDL